MFKWTIPVLALALLNVGCASSSKDPTMPRENERSEPLRVMSLNVRTGSAPDGANAWPNRRALLLRAVRDYDPDLLGTQEALAFQNDEIQRVLPGHGFAGGGRDDGKAKGEFSPIYYRTDRFELVASGQFWLSDTPEVPGSKSWDSAFPRIATWARLRDRRGGGGANRELLFVNTHWDHAGPVARLRAAEIIRARVKSLAGAGAAVIVAGDLNCTEDDEPYAVLTGRGDDALTLTDSYRAAHPERQTEEATFHGFKGTVAGSRIDFILHTAQLETVEAAIDRVSDGTLYPSDHYPVTATLRCSVGDKTRSPT